MSMLTTIYATDEDIAIRASSDFLLLCPRDQKLASGTDGMFASSGRWTLTSPTVDLASCGIAAGNVVQLLGPSAYFKVPGETLVVATVATGALGLRRKGEAAGIGQPPGPPTGLSGVEFIVATLAPQI